MQNKYYASNFFMNRIPVFPISFYENLCDENFNDNEQVYKVKEWLRDENILEILTNSSDSLGNSIERINNGEEIKKLDKVINTALKYMIRMSTRTTPYGILAGISTGVFSDHTELEIADIENFKKRSRPDMEWILGIVNTIEKNKELIGDIRVRFNELHHIKGERINIPFISNCGQNKDLSNNIAASIRYTKQVEFVKDITKEFIKFDDVVKILVDKNPNVEKEKIYSFLFQLLKNEYLISELRPPLTNSNPFLYLIDILSKSEKLRNYYENLLNIKILIEQYNDLKIGEGNVLYRNILKQMKLINKSSVYLQTDLRVKNSKNKLNKNVAKELEKTINAFAKITGKNAEPKYLKEYKEKFIEKYGTYIEVPLMKLIDPDIGLGIPYNSIANSLDREYDKSKIDIFKKNIYDKITNSKTNNIKEIVISDEDIDEFYNNNIKDENISLASSVEINVFVVAKDQEGVDKGDFKLYIGPNYGSYRAGKTFGRFMDILDSDIETEFKKEYKNSKKYFGNDYMIVELTELTRNARNSNISLNINSIENELAISTNYSGSKKKIDIKDLVVGIDSQNNNFYIRYIKNNKKVIFTTNNMLNIRLYSDVSRFIYEISNSNYSNVIDSIGLIGLNHNEYSPRVRYGKTILSPRTWNISNNNFNKQYNSFDEFRYIFNKYKEELQIPKYVYLKDSDNRLLMNLDNNLHLKEIYKQLKKDNLVKIQLTEIDFSFDKLIMNRFNNDKYVSELVIPLTLNSDEIKLDNNIQIKGLETKSIYNYNKNKLDIDDKKRIYLFGDNGWIYVKLYGISERITELIGFDIFDFCKKLKLENKIEKYFFIRYGDPDFHIRLRIKVDTSNMWNIIADINDWLKNLKERGMLSKIVFDTYSREAERYGGIEIIDYAENLFYKDSEYVARLLRLDKLGMLKLSEEYIGIVSVISMMEAFKLKYETQKELFLKLIDKNDLREYFNKDRKNFIKISNSNNEWRTLRELGDGEVLYNLFMDRFESIKEFRKNVDELDSVGKLTNSKENILLSIIHMFCNRYMGDNNWERKILSLTRHSLQSLEYYKKNNL